MTTVVTVLAVAIAILANHVAPVPCSCDLTSNRNALLSLYNATTLAGVPWSTAWDAAQPVCGWSGVSCSGNDVISIVLRNVGMHGTIPDAFTQLPALRTLSISNEGNLTGTLPEGVGAMSMLETVTLLNVRLNGSLPVSLGSLQYLTVLSVGNTMFEGAVPDLSGATSLLSLQLSSMSALRVSSASSLPLSLEYLSLVSLRQHFVFPRVILALSALRVLELVNVTQGATLPVEISNLQALESLQIVSNRLTGTLPSLSSLSSLRYLRITASHLEGPFPSFTSVPMNLTSFDVSLNQFDGTLPSELSLIPNLRTIHAAGNWFSGGLPREWGSLINLETLHLSSNGLAGTIPASFSMLSNLRVLQLDVNQLSGAIAPLFNLTGLTQLNIQGNRFDGTVPPELSNLVNLTKLALGNNSFSRTNFPDLFSKGMTQLEDLQIGGMGITSLPSTVASLQALKYFDLAWNSLGGVFSSAICALANLDTLIYDGNPLAMIPSCLSSMISLRKLMIVSCGLSGELWFLQNDVMPNLTFVNASRNFYRGSLPATLSSMISLATLDLSWNQLNGSLPMSIGNFASLKVLDLSHNRFASSLPSSLFQLSSLVVLLANNNLLEGPLPSMNSTRMATLNLSYNYIDGSLPISIDRLVSLVACDLRSNSLSGPIPDSFAPLKSLTTFNVWANSFSGQLPDSLFNVSTLSLLDLSYNNINGSLPPPCGMRVIQTILVIQNSLSGSLPNDIGCLSYLQTLLLPMNRLEGPLPTSIWALQNLSKLDLSWNTLSGDVVNTNYSLPLPHLKSLFLPHNNLSGNGAFLSVMPGLATVDLSWNSFSGDILSYLSNATLLQVLRISNNAFNETLNWNTIFAVLTEVDLSYNRFSGTLPQDFSLLPVLRDLTVRYNNISGPVPLSIGGLGTLSAYHNQLSGNVSFAALSMLWYLSLGENNLSGRITDFDNASVKQMITLDLSRNAFSGPLPTLWDSFWYLRYLDLSENNFTGVLPPELTRYLWYMADVRVGGNQLSGTVANMPPNPAMGSLRIQNINISNNMLSGPFPFFVLSPLPSLQVLSVANNLFSGELPASWGSMPQLRSLYIANNSANGTLPAAWSSLNRLVTVRMEANTVAGNLSQFSAYPSLVELSISGNRFSGTIPTSWNSQLPSLRTLYLDGNAINGTLPPSLGNLSSLAVLSLGSNQLTGSVPALWADVAVWPSLSTFDISSNFLNGTLPVGLVSGATNLTVLNAASNSLTGTLPYEWFAFSSLRLLNASRNPMRGSLPRSWALLNRLETMDLSQTSLSGALPTNWGDDGSLVSLANFLLSGSFCFRIPLSWMRRGALNSSLSQISSNNCSYSRSSAPSLSAVVTVTKATASTTQSRTDSNSFTSTRDGSLSTTLSASTSLRTMPSSKSLTGMSFNYTPWLTSSLSVSLQITFSHGKVPTNTSSRTSKATATDISSRSENTPNPTSSLSRSLTASVVKQSFSTSLHRTSTLDIVLTPSKSLSASRVFPQIVPAAAFSSSRGLSATVVAAGIVASMLSNGLTSTVSLLQIGQSTRQMLFAACRNLSEPTALFEDWMDNPLQIQLSQMPPMLQSAAGAVVGNTVLMLALLAVRCVLSIGRTLCDGLSLQQWGLSHVLARWPSCASIPLEPTISAAVYIVATSDRTSASVALGICLGGAMVLSIILVHWRTLMILSGNAEVEVVPTPPVVSQVPRRLLTWSNHLSGWWRWFVRDQWAWVAVGSSRSQFEVFRVLVRSYRSAACVHATELDVTWTVVCAVLLGAGFVSSGNCALCRRLSWALFAWSLVRVVLCVWVRPMASRVDNVELVVMSVINSALMLLATVDASDGVGATMAYIELTVLMIKVAGQISSRLWALVDQRREASSRVDAIRNGRLTEGQHQQLEHLVRLICHAERR